VDFGCVQKKELVFKPTLRGRAFTFRETVERGEKVWLTLRLAADDLVASERQVFEVAWDGEWVEKGKDMGEHLKIREVPMEEVASARKVDPLGA
jgi:hypothetical protein